MNQADNKSWNEYQELVLNELKRHNTLIEALRSDVGDLKTEIAMLKIKSSLWGGGAGLAGASIIGAILKAMSVTGG